jgi:hypothetical protein
VIDQEYCEASNLTPFFFFQKIELIRHFKVGWLTLSLKNQLNSMSEKPTLAIMIMTSAMALVTRFNI